ncbi:MAG: HAD-IIIC family phosphatase, partial [Candidatus Omnitrophica bacterium]|nr:HAD-IIIC family phosphatase [Candidatus Omnitrophota bacterium]
GHKEAQVISRSVFSFYKAFFKDQEKLILFVRSFAKLLREDSVLPCKINNEAKFYSFLLNSVKHPLPSRIKCIVLDCDGVLWPADLAEDDFNTQGLDMTLRSPEGKAYLDFQKELLALKEKGFLLAINSKHNPEDIVGEKYSDWKKGALGDSAMLLKKQDFAVIKANWMNKAINLREIAQELNIGIDSLLFLDDSVHERELIRSMCPEAMIPDLPIDPAQYVEFIRSLRISEGKSITDEDVRRTELYGNQRQREGLRIRAISLEDFYHSLDMKVIIREGKENLPYISRIAQLTQRTNQFNLTSERYEDKDIQSFLESTNYQIFSLELIDRFGNDGIIGLMILREGSDTWVINTFCLSCRAIGRTIEQTFMAYVIKALKKRGVKHLRGYYRYTGRNTLVKDLYEKLGFAKFDKSYCHYEEWRSSVTGMMAEWELELEKSDLQIQRWITILDKPAVSSPVELGLFRKNAGFYISNKLTALLESDIEEVHIITAGGGGDILGGTYLVKLLGRILEVINHKIHLVVFTTNLKRGEENPRGGPLPAYNLGVIKDTSLGRFARLQKFDGAKHIYLLDTPNIISRVFIDHRDLPVPIKEGKIIQEMKEWDIKLAMLDVSVGGKALAEDYNRIIKRKKVLTIGLDMGGDILARCPEPKTAENENDHPEKDIKSPVTDTVVLNMLCYTKRFYNSRTILSISAAGGDGELGKTMMQYLLDLTRDGAILGILDNRTYLSSLGSDGIMLLREMLSLDIASEVSTNLLKRLAKVLLKEKYKPSRSERKEVTEDWDKFNYTFDPAHIEAISDTLGNPFSGMKIRNGTRTEALPASYFCTLFIDPLEVEKRINPEVLEVINKDDRWRSVERYFRKALKYTTEMNDPHNREERKNAMV